MPVVYVATDHALSNKREDQHACFMDRSPMRLSLLLSNQHLLQVLVTAGVATQERQHCTKTGRGRGRGEGGGGEREGEREREGEGEGGRGRGRGRAFPLRPAWWKLLNASNLIACCRGNGFRTTLVTVVVGSRGFLHKRSLNNFYTLVKAPHKNKLALEKEMIHRAISGSFCIWCRCNWLHSD